ncbi:hypothetical protein KP509_14G012900 [Ceratopteris richardii]|nr:hypothetical protein KP509_14G012900 [Ceratopteris richardii]
MQALVRVQARVRAVRANTSQEVSQSQYFPKYKEWHDRKAELEYPEMCGGWDDSVQSAEEKAAKRLNKREATLKRERALAYALTHQSCDRPPQEGTSFCADQGSDKQHWGWTWLERWMAARSWEAPQFDGYNEICNDRTKSNPFVAESAIPRKSVAVSPVMVKEEVRYTLEQHSNDCSRTAVTPQRQSLAVASCNMEEASLVSTGGSASSAWSFGPKYRSSRNGKAGSSLADDDSFISSPRVPNYMSTTHSAKAKTRSRSLSTPKQRTVTPERERMAVTSARKRLSFPTTEGSICSAKSTPRHPRALGLTERSPSLKCLPVAFENERYVMSYA